ncbi:complement factor I-like [Homalodisca vitripennis]|uniref:complement factor I-like n=1 Tax=Homalodisca vitripennis TaxID=197043 RepID=UPI001EEBA4F2|nr:complement factor I-like [Homalodisca vitripennis]
MRPLATHLVLHIFLLGNIVGQVLQRSQDEEPQDYCRLPPLPSFGNYFLALCYGQDNPNPACLNVPNTPIPPGWVLTYICNQGAYFPRGQGFVDSRCQGGQWVPPPPPCKERICSIPQDPPNGRYTLHPLECKKENCISDHSRLRDNSLLILQCVAGYEPRMDNSALCIAGDWFLPLGCQRISNRTSNNEDNSLIPRMSKSCLMPTPPKHGTYMSPMCYGDTSLLSECEGIPGTPARDSWTLTFLCDKGYQPSNNQTLYHSKCVDGQWLPALPSCSVSLEDGCTQPRNPAHGRYTVTCGDTQCAGVAGSLVPRANKLSLSCNPGYRPVEGYVISTCTDRMWTPPPPTCVDESNNTILIDSPDVSELQAKYKSCVLPQPPQHGYYSLFSNKCFGVQLASPACQRAPGEKVPHLQVVSVSCDDGYRLGGMSGDSVTALTSCDDGNWSQPFPECYRLCPNLKSLTVEMECYQGPKLVSCDAPMLPGSTITSKCRLNHATVDDPRNLECLTSGQWSGRLPYCKPNCGLSKLHNYDIEPTVVGGTASPLGYFPWHAALYQQGDSGKWENKCGGTLISPHIILTAAHCVTQQANKLSPKQIKVALGKYHRDWYANETETVTRDVRDIEILPNYLGQESFLDLDIALMGLDSPVPVNSFVMPACVDYYLNHPLQPDMTGYLVGWGKTLECARGESCGDTSDTLMYTNTSFLSFRQCYEAMQRIKRLPFSRITTDKFCAGNGTYSVAQQGDSGGGVTFEFEGIHYVKGVVSSKISLQDSYSFSAFTNVSHHITWIRGMASYFDKRILEKTLQL